MIFDGPKINITQPLSQNECSDLIKEYSSNSKYKNI